MADPITREQVERAIKAAEHGYMDPWISYFGADWRGVVPRYVLAAYGDDSGGWETAAAALTRWRDELAAAEPIDDTAPERLRERREALGLERGDSIFARASIYEGNIAHVEAEWRPGEPYLTVTHTTVPLAILRAMLEAIDAQQGGA